MSSNTGDHQAVLAVIRPYWVSSGRTGGDQAIVAVISPYWGRGSSGCTGCDQAVLAVVRSQWWSSGHNRSLSSLYVAYTVVEVFEDGWGLTTRE